MVNTLKSIGIKPPANLLAAANGTLTADGANGTGPAPTAEGVAGGDAGEPTLRQRAKKA